MGIIDADPESFRWVDRDWMPSLPAHSTGTFGLADILSPPVSQTVELSGQVG